MSEFQFTNKWFDASARGAWDNFVPQVNPSKILEVGSFEGASACYLIEKVASLHPIELHCIDTWEGGEEHAGMEMSAVESRFHANVQQAVKGVSHAVDLVLHKGYSDVQMAKLLGEGKSGYFDFVYIDGSHQAPDVLCDAVLGFKLLRVGGLMAFDDYLWSEDLPYGKDPIRCPKPAIDAFTNLYCRKLQVIPLASFQLYAQKTAV